jgi:Mn2+/Fe2+ NRAMP family transporter
VPPASGWWRKVLAFATPEYLVAVGYMEPGHWTTDLTGGERRRRKSWGIEGHYEGTAQWA